MENGRKQPAAWPVFGRGILLSLASYLVLLLLLTLLLVKGALGEEGAFPMIAAACVISAMAGGLLCARSGPWGTLPCAMVSVAGFAAVLAALGMLCWAEGVTWAGRGGVLLLCALGGGLLAGLLGGKRGRRVKRKGKRR